MKIMVTTDDGRVIHEISVIGSHPFTIESIREELFEQLRSALERGEIESCFTDIKTNEALQACAIQKLQGMTRSSRSLGIAINNVLVGINTRDLSRRDMFDPMVPNVREMKRIVTKLVDTVDDLSKINIRDKEVAKLLAPVEVGTASD